MVPLFRDGRFFLPHAVPEREVNEEKVKFMDYFLHQEYRLWPATKHSDILDCCAWSQYKDCQITFPEGWDDASVQGKEIDWDTSVTKGSWMCD